MRNYQAEIDVEAEGMQMTEDTPIFNNVTGMPDDWYWKDKPLHKNTIKVGQKYWVDMGRLSYELTLCYERGMNCSETCCKQTYCAPEIGDCIYYLRKDFNELYVCIGLMMLIVVGIPTCIKTMEVIIMFRCCMQLDEDENAFTGGITMCECCTKTITCRYFKDWRKKRASLK